MRPLSLTMNFPTTGKTGKEDIARQEFRADRYRIYTETMLDSLGCFFFHHKNTMSPGCL